MREINLKTMVCGPDGNIHPGVCTVSKEFAEALVKAKHADYTKAMLTPPKPAEAPKEKAVVKAPETAAVPKQVQVKVPEAPKAEVKAPEVKAPEAKVTKIVTEETEFTPTIKAPWGKGE